jgi:chromate transport protein ChrA
MTDRSYQLDYGVGTEMRQTRAGFVSVACAATATLIILAAGLYARMSSHPGEAGIVFGMWLVVAGIIIAVGCTTAVVGLLRRQRRRDWARWGLIANVAVAAFSIPVLILLGF